MWNGYEQKTGLKNIYKNLWKYISREEKVISIQKDNPSLIKDFIIKEIGNESFNQVSNIPFNRFEELYKPDDWKIMGKLINRSDDEMNREIRLIISLLLLFLSGKPALKNIL
jgi:hypothetical protein